MRYEYGWQRIGYRPATVELAPTKAIAESAARDWVTSPLRTGSRRARTLRRPLIRASTLDGYTGLMPGLWEVLDTWSTPESAMPEGEARAMEGNR